MPKDKCTANNSYMSQKRTTTDNEHHFKIQNEYKIRKINNRFHLIDREIS